MGGKLIYIQNPRTRQLLGSNFGWVDSPDQARTFDSATVAYDFALENSIAEAEIVFQKSSKIESVLQDIARNRQAKRTTPQHFGRGPVLERHCPPGPENEEAA